MEQIPFEYGGLHFIPEQRFEPQGQRHRRIPLSRMGQEAEADLFPGEFAYSHSGFYEAATVKDCDIFRCVENRRLYVPCENDLQLYEEPPNQERGRGYER
ncbi:MAG: hypothetical protein LUG44_04385 [Clostridiales bacterium]|nr:hypothetical protein [Clostridiales bacterium]